MTFDAREGDRVQGVSGYNQAVGHTTCVVAGGGPAGAMLGLLLARRGVEVLVLEKHGDFLRDFRGDTIHPSTMEIMDELGLADRLLRLPHTRARRLRCFAHVRAGRVAPHREWMIRAFAIGLSIATMRLVFIPALVIVANPTDGQIAMLSVASFTVAFVVHASLAEAWIRATRSKSVSGAGAARAA